MVRSRRRPTRYSNLFLITFVLVHSVRLTNCQQGERREETGERGEGRGPPGSRCQMQCNTYLLYSPTYLPAYLDENTFPTHTVHLEVMPFQSPALPLSFALNQLYTVTV